MRHSSPLSLSIIPHRRPGPGRPAALAAIALLSVLAMGFEACPADPEWAGSDAGDFGGADGAVDAGDASCLQPTRWLACGESVLGDSSDASLGSTELVDSWPADVAVGNFDGPEVTYAWRATASETVTWALVHPSPTEVNHDLFVLDGGDGTCDSRNALRRGFNDVTFEAVAGQTYYLVLDGFAGDAGPYEVALECTPGPVPDGPATPPVGCDQPGDRPDGATAVLQIHPLDIWGQQLPPGGFTLAVYRDGQALTLPAGDSPVLPLDGPAEYTIELDAADHQSMKLSLTWSGAELAVEQDLVDGSSPHGLAVSHGVFESPDGDLPKHALYLGLAHRWFASAGRPARRGNDLELFMNGEAAWSAVADAIEVADGDVLASLWKWRSDFELRRGALSEVRTAEQRAAQGVLRVIQDRMDELNVGASADQPRATARILVNERGAQDSGSNPQIDDALHATGADLEDFVEHMVQANPSRGKFDVTPQGFFFLDRVLLAHPEAAASESFEDGVETASLVQPRTVNLLALSWLLPDLLAGQISLGSYHQKFIVTDPGVAFVGGMNLNYTDWDSGEHRVFDPRRLHPSASQADRDDVLQRRAVPDNAPRADYMLKIEGPAAQDVAEVFQTRWDEMLAEGHSFAAQSTDFEIERDIAPVAGGAQIQITTTMPQPYPEHSIAETWFKAVDNADRFIFIEDQYFRIPLLVDRIVERMNEAPDLKLLVVTRREGSAGAGCYWTREMDEVLTQFGDRYKTVRLRAFDVGPADDWSDLDEEWAATGNVEALFEDVYIHSKMMIVDDVFMSVGSANKNNRGILYEAEMNVAVVDPTFVRQSRREIFASMLGRDVAQISDDVDAWWLTFESSLLWNEYVLSDWEQADWTLDADVITGGAVVDPWATGSWGLDRMDLDDLYRPVGLIYPLTFETYCIFDHVGPDVT